MAEAPPTMVTEQQVVVNVEGPTVAGEGLKGFDKMIPMPLEEDLIMCMACCCVKYSIYKKVPECIGCSAKNECLCYKYALQERCSFNPTLFFEDCKCAMCDFREGNDIKDQGCGYTFGECVCLFCVECRGETAFAMPTTVCKGIQQCFCLDSRCALPCDDEVPFQIGCLSQYLAGKPQPVETAAAGPQVTVTTTTAQPSAVTDMER